MKMTPLSILYRASGLRQSDLAETIGTSVAWISAVMTGRNELNKDQLRSLASALKMPMSRVELAALETRRSWLRDQTEDVSARLRSVHKSA